MGHRLRSAAFAAGLAAIMAAVPVRAATTSPLQSFGVPYGGFTLPSGIENGSPLMRNLVGAPSFAGSSLIAPGLALDTGRNLDIAGRFDNYTGLASPLLSVVSAPYLSLANGGNYAGFTYTPGDNFRLRFGASLNADWLEHLTIDPYAGDNMPMAYRTSVTRSLMAGFSWSITDYADIGMHAISSGRDGVPLGFPAGLPMRSGTDAIGVSARLGLGGGWDTKITYSAMQSQLDLRSGVQTSANEKSYAIAISKRGVFGDDAVGFALSRPAPSLIGSFAGLATSTDLPPMVIAHSNDQYLLPRTPETDFQLGYVTNFLDGALALQANAAYQMNYQGQTGATAVSLLSRAKIKF
jgi:hypothetical protein